jgi:hypothetical protein
MKKNFYSNYSLISDHEHKRSRAEHKYNPHTKEGARRIAQSYGRKMSMLDMPHMIGFLNRAGIELFNELPEGYSDGDTIKFT